VQSIRATYRASDARVALRFELPPEGIHIHIELERAIPCGLLVNELVTNAFKHAFPGEDRGEIVIGLSEDGDGRIECTVADNGVGLPDDARLAQSTSLGLQLVPLFVDQLHGAMTIERAGGTRFCVGFPRRSTKKEAP
jgi:two-component sensor histidine kinase